MQRTLSYNTNEPRGGGGNDHFNKEDWSKFQRRTSHHNIFKHFVKGVSSKNLDTNILESQGKAEDHYIEDESKNMGHRPETVKHPLLSPILKRTIITAETTAKKHTIKKIVKEKEPLEDSEFSQIFVNPNHYDNAHGDIAGAEFYERQSFLKRLSSTDEALLRREIPVATWVRNSTILTRSYHKFGDHINPNQLFQSMHRRQKLVRAADKFNLFKKIDTKSRHKLVNRRRSFDQILDATIKEIEHETFTLTNGEREAAFPKDFAFPYIGAPKKPRGLVGKKKKRRRSRHRKRKGKNQHRVDLSAAYDLRHSNSRKALKSLQQELLNKIIIEKYGDNKNV
jgi:hypothetical protein